jgi:hypothetical protein
MRPLSVTDGAFLAGISELPFEPSDAELAGAQAEAHESAAEAEHAFCPNTPSKQPFS